jgi:hypothetical protein
MGWGWRGGGALRRPYQFKVRRGCEQARLTSALVPRSTPYNLPFWSLIRLSLGCLWDPPSIIYSLDKSKTGMYL